MAQQTTDNEKQRLIAGYEEEFALHRAIDAVKNRLLEERVREREAQWHAKETELRDNELATLNILEDARTLEEQLEEQRDRLDRIIASMGEGLLLVDESFHITLINAMAATLLGVRAEDVIGKDIRTIITIWKGDAQVTDAEQPITLVFSTDRSLRVSLADDLYYETAERRKFPVTLVVTPLSRKKEGRSVVIVFRDITEEKTLDEARTNFISLASHQLRTPLTAVKWYTELLMDKGIGALSDAQEKFAQQIFAGANRLSETINLLLSFARIEGGVLEINPKPLDIGAFVKIVVEELAPLAKKGGVSLVVNEPFPDIPSISLDPSLLRETLASILSNAIRYSYENGTVTVSLEKGEKEALIAVQDTGIGIPEALHDRIYEKFFRADNAVKKAPEGTGLGLPLAKSLIELWGGRIWFTSKEGKGSTFYFSIPYKGLTETKKGKSLA